MIKKIVRYVINCGETETIRDALHRHKFNLLKKIYKKKYSIVDLKTFFIENGLKKNDVIMLQSSWRAFIGFQGSPKDVIDTILEIIGEEGTLLMPTFSGNIKHIDLYRDNSKLGAISEEFRKMDNVKRSSDSFFPISGLIKDADAFLEDHINSKKPFDEYSPFGKLLKKDGKLVFLGLGKKPYKVSFIHYFTTLMSTHDDFYSNCYNQKVDCIIYDNKIEQKINKKIIVRNDKCSNNNKNIKLAMKKTKHRSSKIGCLDLYICESNDLITTMTVMDKKGMKFYNIKDR